MAADAEARAGRSRVLLDTQLLVWAAGDAPLMPDRARELLTGEDELHYSAASIWEVAIKSRLGRPDFDVDPEALDRGLSAAGYLVLPVTAAHAAATTGLPWPGPSGHKDPFDRLLLAQAGVEAMTLATTDHALSLYARDVLDVR